MELLLFIITVIVGYLGAGIFGNLLNWPDAGAVFAIATVGAVLLWTIRHHKEEK